MFLATRALSYVLTAIAVTTLMLSVIPMSDARLDPESIAGLWTFEEGKGEVVKDLSGNGTDGIFVGDLAWAEGKFGGGLEFNGTNTWVVLGTKGEAETLAALDFSDSEGFSIHAWVYGDELPAKEWVHIVGTWDGEQLHVYVNGDLQNSVDAAGPPWASPEEVYIGADPGCGMRCQWEGIIDEIAIFDTSLTGDQVVQLGAGIDGALAVDAAGKITTTWGKIKSAE